MNLSKQVLRLAVPSILANITIPLVGIVDTAIVGHISDAAAIGGIAIGTMLFDLLYWNFGFLRVGTSGMAAQAYGRHDRVDCAKILAQSLAIAGFATLLVWVLQWFFVTAVLACVPCSTEVAHLARRYFFVRIWAAPATISLMAFKGWFIGMQDTISPMLCDIVVNVVNMVVSYSLAVYTPLGFIGVAYGTVIAQFCGLILAIVLTCTRYRSYIALFTEAKDWIRWTQLRKLMTLNGNLFIRSLCFMVVYVGFTSIASDYGNEQLAVASIMMKLFMFFSYFVDGFAFAGEALVGRFIGEQNLPALRASVRVLFLWSLVVGVVFTLIYAMGSKQCFALMTNDPQVLTLANAFILWLIAMPIVSTLAFMWDGIYIGATAGIEIRNAMIWAAVGFVVVYVALYRCCGIQALYMAYFAHLIARVLYLTIRYKKSIITTISMNQSL